ncbi:hypothetical protein [Halorubrum halodurans]|nr:hypothetical protein [Halorubrum halodurans]
MSDILKREGYEVDPTGTSGPDGGREAIFTDGDRTGILHCSVQKDDWVEKAHDDARKAVENFDQEFDLFTFVTTQDPAGVMRDRVEEELASEWNIQTKVWDYERIRNELVGDSENHDLIREHLSVDPNRPFVDVETEVDSLYEDLIERVKRQKAPDGTTIQDGARVVAHVIPQEAIDDHHARYVEDLPQPPIFSKGDVGTTDRPKLKITNANRRRVGNEERDRYTVIHRDGWTEGVFGSLYPTSSEGGGVIRESVDQFLLKFVDTSLNAFEEAEIYPPYYVYVAVLDAEDYTIDYPNNMRGPTRERTFGESEVRLNRVRIDSIDTDVPEAMRKSLDQLWRYCGWDGSIHYERHDEGKTDEFEFSFRGL